MRAAILLLSACRSPVDGGSASLQVTGTWEYAGAEAAPDVATLRGTFVISGQNGRRFDGTIDLVATDNGGKEQRMTGIVSGTVLDSVTVDFDAMLGTATRRHVARVQHDSLVGGWVEQNASFGTSGSFRARRKVAP